MTHQIYIGLLMLMIAAATHLQGQTILRGIVMDESTGEPIIGANVIIQGTTTGAVTDFDGEYIIKTDLPLPIDLHISYVGFNELILHVTDPSIRTKSMLSNNIQMEEMMIVADRIPDKHKKSALVIESLDLIDIKETPSLNFYDGLGSLKDVDITAASLGFKVINTRGFNSTSPVRSLQIIDGVDNQSPGLNFSLGNFLGAPEMDVLRADIIVGASGAYYGPNAFNGVISMETKNPFIHTGLSGMIKAGERNLLEAGVRYADIIKNKNGNDLFAYKFNLYALRADDWRAENYEPITASKVPSSNPGRFDAVNIYGDEYYAPNDFSKESDLSQNPGLGNFYRTGYRETDLVDYDTRNYKANLALHLRTRPSENTQSPEFILASNFGSGTTVYQGDNRFSLRDILFFQHRIEFRKTDKYFIRAYVTHEDAGNSYDPYFTALRLLAYTKSNQVWATDYRSFWKENILQKMWDCGYPVPPIPPELFPIIEANAWLILKADSLTRWHELAEAFANQKNPRNPAWVKSYLVPGTEEFKLAFDDITSRLNNQSGGTRFFDKSMLFHTHGEYSFTAPLLIETKIGANYRLYAPRSDGTIFSDTANVKIRNSEIGIYGGFEKKLFQNKLNASFTTRFDKNENLNWIVTPAASLVYSPVEKTFLRFSYSSAIRNPTLTDQYLFLNVGPAILAGHTSKVDSLITLESFEEALNGIVFLPSKLIYFGIDPIRPEHVRTLEGGIRTTLFNSLYVDIGYYQNTYKDFLGYLIGLKAKIPTGGFVLPEDVQVYRYSANSKNKVNTQGFSIGLNYYLSTKISCSGNYSFNELRKTVEDDPIIPAYNTPKHKFNIGVSGREIKIRGIKLLNQTGFSIHYKWVQGFQFEGSPQFTGHVPSYGLVDAQINVRFEKIKSTIKVGTSNLLNKKHFETYGGPEVGRLAYASFTYQF